MSGLQTIEPEHELAEEPIKKPAPKWRNKYYSELPMQFPHRTVGPGEWWGRDVHPTRDLAETVAAEFISMMEHWMQENGLGDNIEYMGALPEEDET